MTDRSPVVAALEVPAWEATAAVALAYGTVLLAAGILILPVWLRWVRGRGPLLPPQRQRAVAWSFLQVLALAYFGLFLWRALLAQVFEPAWAIVLAMPLEVGTVLFAVRAILGGRPYQLGLHLGRPAHAAVVGYLGYALCTPVVYLIYGLAVQLTTWLDAGQSVDTHELAKVFPDQPLVAIAVAVLAAPVSEELFFRGVLQPYLIQRPQAAGVILAITVVWAAALAGQSWMTGDWPLWPLLYLTVVTPAYLLSERLTARWLPRPGVGRAIFVTALLFAVAHSGVWPSPIPIFFLALGLGYVGYRTQNLIAPVVMHGLFNLVSVVMLLAA
jgi:membrane protease YdiL (CAAX protease family)